jgi:hypothetical protein
VLNETWGVFVGWAVWTKLELYRTPESVGRWTAPLMDEWAQRLAVANQSGELLGYYEPDDPEERKVARKRYVAPSNGITPEGAKLLLKLILEESQQLVDRGGEVIEATQDTSAEPLSCN